MNFFWLYWTYPTIVDIQTAAPSELDMPAFSICNPIGYNYTSICTDFDPSLCIENEEMMKKMKVRCAKEKSDLCINDTVSDDFQIIRFEKFLLSRQLVTQADLTRIQVRLEEYLRACRIDHGVTSKYCNLDNVRGSYYKRDYMPQFCYTIYSLWGDVNKKRERISRESHIVMVFELNASRRGEDRVDSGPRSSIPENPYVQIAVHSPHFPANPYFEGNKYEGGKAYEVRLTMSEKHLLESPYTTNCTNYLEAWRKNQGRGSIDHRGALEECRMEKWNSTCGCVPSRVDYPHSNTVCGHSLPALTNENYKEVEEQCRMLTNNCNQPCDSISYATTNLGTNFKKLTVLERISGRAFAPESS